MRSRERAYPRLMRLQARVGLSSLEVMMISSILPLYVNFFRRARVHCVTVFAGGAA